MEPPDSKQTAKKRRAVRRKRGPLTAFCRSGDQEASAQIVNISLSGALLRCASLRPIPGALVKIWWDPSDAHAPIELTGTVVRSGEMGFAIHFREVTQELRQLLGDPS